MNRSAETRALLCLVGALSALSCAPPQGSPSRVAAQVVLSPEVEALTASVEHQGTTQALTLPVPGRPREWTIEIVATREQNPAAKGSEVWLFDAQTPEQSADWARAESSGPEAWLARESAEAHSGQVLIAAGSSPQRLTLRVVGSALTLRLLKHPWSGVAEVAVNGAKTRVDLYAAVSGIEVLTFSADGSADGGLSFELPPLRGERAALSFLPQPAGTVHVQAVHIDGQPVTVVEGRAAWTRPPTVPRVAVVTWWLALGVLLVFGVALFLYPTIASTRRLTTLCLLAAALCGSWWALVAYPGYLSGDSVDQWSQALQNRYSPWHPPIMAMLMHATQWFTTVPWLFTLIESCLFWFALLWALSVAVRNRRVWLLCSLLVAAHPVLWLYSTTLWKDVWVATAALLGMGFTVRFIRDRSPRAMWGAACCFGLAFCFRHNAVTLLPIPLAAFWFGTRQLATARRLVLVALTALVMVAPAKAISRLPTVDRTGGVLSADLLAPYLFGVVARLSTQSPDWEATRGAIDATFGPGTFERVRAKYSCECSNYLLYGDRALSADDALARNRAFVDDYAWKLARSHVPELIDHRVCSLRAFMQVDALSLPSFPYVNTNQHGLTVASWWPEARMASVRAADWVSRGPLMRHYLFDLVLLLSLGLSVVRRNWALLATSAAGLAYLAPFLIIDTCPDWRYQFLNYLMSLICLGMLVDAGVDLVKRRAARSPSPSGG